MLKTHISKIISRKKDSHKGDYGKVLVVAGSRGMTGAASLSAMGALRAGSGLVTCAVPETLNVIMETKLTEIMTLPVSASADGSAFSNKAEKEILKASEKCDVVALGPGLGQSQDIHKLVRALLRKLGVPVVLDADGLNVMAGEAETIKSRKAGTVITPHPGEAARLLGKKTADVQKERLGLAKRLVEITGAVVCLKGHGTVVASPEGEVFVNDTGNSGMATGGSGDVLTGIIASFIGQGLNAYSATVSGAYLHGLAGDIAAQEKGIFSMIASDIVDSLNKAFAKAGL